MSQRLATDQTDAISSATKTHVSTTSDNRHSFNSATTHQISETNITEMNIISNATEEVFDIRIGSTPETKDTSNKKRDKRNKMTDWKFLTFDYQVNEWTQEDTIQPLSNLSVPEQESALIEDLLFVLIVRFDAKIFCSQIIVTDRESKESIFVYNN